MSLRIGIVGSGFMAGVHSSALKQIEGVEIKAVTSLSIEEASEFITKHRLSAQAYHSAEAMFAEENLEAVYFCIPPYVHNGEVEMAAARGIHLFLEKPIALDSSQAKKMVDVIESSGIKSQVGFQLRFRKSVRRLKGMIDKGQSGRPVMFTGRYWTNMQGKEWWRDRKRSGGQIFEQVIHIYDLATYLFGPIETTKGILANLTHSGRADYTIEDNSIGMLRFANGAMGVITGTNCAVPMHFFGDLRAVCENVVLDYICTGQNWVNPDRAVVYLGEEDREEIVENDDLYLLESLDFIAAIRENRETVTPARHGFDAIRLVEKVIESAEKEVN